MDLRTNSRDGEGYISPILIMGPANGPDRNMRKRGKALRWSDENGLYMGDVVNKLNRSLRKHGDKTKTSL